MKDYDQFSDQELDRICEMAWEDRTPFEAIYQQFGLVEGDVSKLMKRMLKTSSFVRWRRRVQGRKTKHASTRPGDVTIFHCYRQRAISNNRISKR